MKMRPQRFTRGCILPEQGLRAEKSRPINRAGLFGPPSLRSRFPEREKDWTAQNCMGMVRGLLFDWIIQGMDYDLADRYREEFEIFVRGLAPADSERGPQ